MGRINVVTSFSPAGWESYGRPMLKSFAWGWPPIDVDIYCYHESSIPDDNAAMRAIWVNLDNDQDRKAFMERHKDPVVDRDRLKWDARYAATFYKELAVKFSHKVWAMTSAPRDCDWLIWLDGDVETRAPITHEALGKILKPDYVTAFLGRRWWSHTETGFLAFNMRSPYGSPFLDDLREVYKSDKIMEFENNHTDCAAFDHVRKEYEAKGHVSYDLGEWFRGPDLDVMAHSVLGPYLWHQKGMHRKFKAYGKVA